MSATWKVGDRAKWVAKSRGGVPVGASWDPASLPGAISLWLEERARDRRNRNLHVTVVSVEDGLPSLVRAEDCFEFDPREDLHYLVPAFYEGWEDPLRRAWREQMQEVNKR